MAKSIKEYNDEAKNTVDFSDFINDRCLEVIRIAEGHDGYSAKDKTTYYGITQKGIDGLHELPRKYSIQIPEWMLSAKVDKITEEQARQIAGYHAVLNTMLVDDFSDCPNFSNLPLEERSGMLTYLHNVSPYALRAGFAAEAPGSFLQAVRSNNVYNMLLALMSHADGTPIEEFYESETPGYTRRVMSSVFATANKDFIMNPQQVAEMDIRLKQPNFMKEAHSRMRGLSDDWFAGREMIVDYANKDMQGKADESEPVQKEEPKLAKAQPTEEDEMRQKASSLSTMMYDFTNKVKKLFTNKEEIAESNPADSEKTNVA